MQFLKKSMSECEIVINIGITGKEDRFTVRWQSIDIDRI
jgi:hypothetical protein